MKVILVPAPDKVPDPEKEAETLGRNIPSELLQSWARDTAQGMHSPLYGQAGIVSALPYYSHYSLRTLGQAGMVTALPY